MHGCTRLKRLPITICKLKCLSFLSLLDCSELESFPDILDKMECLEDLQLSGAATIKMLPSSIENLTGLKYLQLKNCKNLEMIPNSMCKLTSLIHINVSGCSKLNDLTEDLGHINHLRSLYANKTIVSQLTHSVGYWKQITELELAFRKLTEIPEVLYCVSSLMVLDLRRNNFESLPAGMKQLSQLQILHLSNGDMLRSLPELPLHLESLQTLDCKQLRSLPELPSNLEEIDASELKIVNRRGTCAENSIEFLFANSNKLDKNASNILSDAHLRFQHMATAWRYSIEEDFKLVPLQTIETPSISFCFPGSSILNWISYQSSRSSLSIDLRQHWCNERFIGFALCAVIFFEEKYDHPALFVKCNYSFKTNHGDAIHFNCYLRATCIDVSINSDHVLLAYDPCFDAKLPEGDYTFASFEFRPYNSNSTDLLQICKVKCCGVCPVYAKSTNAQPNISNDKFRNKDYRNK